MVITHTSQFRVVPKHNKPGKWQLIVDLFSPGTMSINDGINPHQCPVNYSRLDEALAMISRLGRSSTVYVYVGHSRLQVCLLHNTIHLDDRPLLVMKWDNKIFLEYM